jgi:hypothetical protein
VWPCRTPVRVWGGLVCVVWCVPYGVTLAGSLCPSHGARVVPIWVADVRVFGVLLGSRPGPVWNRVGGVPDAPLVRGIWVSYLSGHGVAIWDTSFLGPLFGTGHLTPPGQILTGPYVSRPLGAPYSMVPSPVGLGRAMGYPQSM